MRLYGKNPVIERLKENPKSIKRISIVEEHPDLGYVRQKGKQWGINIVIVPQTKIQKMAQSLNTQGIIADIDDASYMDFQMLLDHAYDKKRSLVFLDNLTDPQNFGGIIRTCGSLGGFDIVIPTTESVGITESVLRVACGGENYLAISRVSNLGNAIEKAKAKGFFIIGASTKDAKSIEESQLQFPLGVVMGSEDKGMRDIIRKRLDLEIMIPMKHQRMSLNVAHATSIVCYEINRQKNK